MWAATLLGVLCSGLAPRHGQHCGLGLEACAGPTHWVAMTIVIPCALLNAALRCSVAWRPREMHTLRCLAAVAVALGMLCMAASTGCLAPPDWSPAAAFRLYRRNSWRMRGSASGPLIHGWRKFCPGPVLGSSCRCFFSWWCCARPCHALCRPCMLPTPSRLTASLPRCRQTERRRRHAHQHLRQPSLGVYVGKS